jgi:hypothetical protein
MDKFLYLYSVKVLEQRSQERDKEELAYQGMKPRRERTFLFDTMFRKASQPTHPPTRLIPEDTSSEVNCHSLTVTIDLHPKSKLRMCRDLSPHASHVFVA